MPIVAHGVSKLTGVPIRFNASHMAKPPHLPSSASSGLLYVYRGLLCLHRGLTTCLRRGFLYLRQKLQSKPTIDISTSRIAFSTPSMIVMSTPRTTIYMPRTTIYMPRFLPFYLRQRPPAIPRFISLVAASIVFPISPHCVVAVASKRNRH